MDQIKVIHETTIVHQRAGSGARSWLFEAKTPYQLHNWEAPAIQAECGVVGNYPVVNFVCEPDGIGRWRSIWYTEEGWATDDEEVERDYRCSSDDDEDFDDVD